jgi:hypothetical protein
VLEATRSVLAIARAGRPGKEHLMPEDRLKRREFLKVTIAAAAAAGLSHFRILNLGGTGVALAAVCERGEDPDQCDANSIDWCNPGGSGEGAEDICGPDPSPGGTDMCPDDSPGGDGDFCDPQLQEPDVCAPTVDPPEPDVCNPGYLDPDVCIEDTTGDGDLCAPGSPDPDVCAAWPLAPDNGGDECAPPDPEPLDICDIGGAPDVCEPAAVPPHPAEPDSCLATPGAAVGELFPDVCIADSDGDRDVCPDPSTFPADVCSPTYDPDICDPAVEPADEPSPVTVSSFDAQPGVGPAAPALGVLGGVVAALGAAVWWVRRRLGAIAPEEPEAE